MSEEKVLDIEEREQEDEDESGSDGVIRALGDLPPETIVSATALARMLGRSTCTIKRAVRRGELPPAVKFLGRKRWTVGAILEHMERRLEDAAKESERLKRKFPEISA